jgi:hypothetical protein
VVGVVGVVGVQGGTFTVTLSDAMGVLQPPVVMTLTSTV